MSLVDTKQNYWEQLQYKPQALFSDFSKETNSRYVISSW
jgi:hypothetical protein